MASWCNLFSHYIQVYRGHLGQDEELQHGTFNCSHLGGGQGLDGPGFGVFSLLICWTIQVTFGTAVRVVFYSVTRVVRFCSAVGSQCISHHREQQAADNHFVLHQCCWWSHPTNVYLSSMARDLGTILWRDSGRCLTLGNALYTAWAKLKRASQPLADITNKMSHCPNPAPSHVDTSTCSLPSCNSGRLLKDVLKIPEQQQAKKTIRGTLTARLPLW